MKNKIIMFLFFLSVVQVKPSNWFSKNDPTKISKAEQNYYEENGEWEYLEKVLIKRLDEVSSYN
jgi:hypothetical protein